MAKITIPTIHLNGTSGRDLLEQLAKASSALNVALMALAEAVASLEQRMEQSRKRQTSQYGQRGGDR